MQRIELTAKIIFKKENGNTYPCIWLGQELGIAIMGYCSYFSVTDLLKKIRSEFEYNNPETKYRYVITWENNNASFSRTFKKGEE